MNDLPPGFYLPSNEKIVDAIGHLVIAQATLSRIRDEARKAQDRSEESHFACLVGDIEQQIQALRAYL